MKTQELFTLNVQDVITQNANETVCIASRPGMGKTALAIYLGLNFAKTTGQSVRYLAFEEDIDLCYTRIACEMLDIDKLEITQNQNKLKDSAEVADMRERLTSLDFKVISLFSTDTRDIEKQLEDCQNLGLVIIDGLENQFPKRRDNRLDELENNLVEIRGYSADKSIPIIFTYTVNRAVEKKRNKRPTLTYLNDREILEEYVDKVLFIYREEYYTLQGDRDDAEVILFEKKENTVSTFKYNLKATSKIENWGLK